MTGIADEAAPFEFPYPIAGQPFRLCLHTRPDPISTSIRMHAIWQRPLSSFMVKHLKPGNCVVDVGAHIGYFAVMSSLLVGVEGAVLAYEPDQRNWDLLRRNADFSARNIFARRAAVGGVSGTLPLSVQGNPAMTRLDDAGGAGPAVPVLRLSDELARVRRLDFVKIDVQGLERPVLEDLAGLIQRRGFRPLIVVEITPSAALAGDPELDWLRALLERLDMKAHLFVDTGKRVVPPVLEFGTLRAVLRDMAAWDDEIDVDLLLSPAEYGMPPPSRQRR